MQLPGSSQQTYISLLEQAVSPSRLRPYRLSSDSDDLAGGARYIWNMALCESLYPSLHSLEIALRNTLHTELSRIYGVTWYADPAVVVVGRARAAVAAATRALLDAGKQPSPGKIVAELTFGFWTSLFNVAYERPIWQRLLSRTSVFPHAGTQRQRSALSARMNRIRVLRNRVFHHEPVWHWRDLSYQHGGVLESIGWIAPVLKHIALTLDRFPSIYQAGPTVYRAHIIAFCKQRGASY
jgi:hypothetical protein